MEKEKIILGNCYYHAGKFAVTTCTNCGVSICKECAVKDFDKNIICVQCGNRMLKEDHKAFRKEVKDRGGMFSEGVEFIIIFHLNWIYKLVNLNMVIRLLQC